MSSVTAECRSSVWSTTVPIAIIEFGVFWQCICLLEFDLSRGSGGVDEAVAERRVGLGLFGRACESGRLEVFKHFEVPNDGREGNNLRPGVGSLRARSVLGQEVAISEPGSLVETRSRASENFRPSIRRYFTHRAESLTNLGPSPVCRHFCSDRSVTPMNAAMAFSSISSYQNPGSVRSSGGPP